jgi:hypothetical protein
MRGSTQIRVTVESAATAIPALVEALGDRGIDVVEASERRPSFDEVFAALVERAREPLDDEDRDGAVPAHPDHDGSATEAA